MPKTVADRQICRGSLILKHFSIHLKTVEGPRARTKFTDDD